MISSRGVDGKWPGGETLAFEIADVVALGKQRRYNDFVTRFLARLRSGTEVMISAGSRSDDDQRWLRKMSRRVPFGGVPSRDCPEITTWHVLASEPDQRASPRGVAETATETAFRPAAVESFGDGSTSSSASHAAMLRCARRAAE